MLTPSLLARPGRTLAATLALLVALAAAARAQGSLPPVEIYVKMRAAVNALPVPPYIAFTVQDASTRKYALFQDRLRIVTRVADAHAWERLLQDATGNPARTPPRVVTTLFYPGTVIERAGEFPLADFGLRPRTGRPGMFEASGTPEPAPAAGSLKVIGGVSTYNLSYRVVDLGDAETGSAAVYHLGLTPVRDPGHNVLREVWVDKTTFLPKRYVAERYVENGGLSFRYLITVDTAVIENHLVNVAASGHFEVHRALIVNYAGDGRWTISDVSFPTDPPAWIFDPDHYKDHSGEPIPAL